MKKNVSLFLAALVWLTVLSQYYLMVENSVDSLSEITIRFFSYFTILTNILVATFFSLIVIKNKKGTLSIIDKPGTLTAVTIYITIVGLVYQILLRPIWDPKGFQMIVDELLHSVIPVIVIVYWFVYEEKSSVKYGQIPKWLFYPLIYLVYILIRGSFSDFYPYPFVDVSKLSLLQVLTNSVGLIVLFFGISALFVKIGKMFKG